MQICRNLIQKISIFLPKGFLAIGVFSLLMLPLAVHADDFIIWELDNHFTEEGGNLSLDGTREEFNIKKGDTVRFINMGATVHDVGNQFFSLDGQTFFENELFGSTAQSPGDTFTTDPIDLVGEIPFICFIHGEDDMAGTIVVTEDVEPSPTPTPAPGKSFTFECPKRLSRGPAGLETLVLSLGGVESCTLKLTNLEPDTFVEVSSILRAGFRSSIDIEPQSGMTNEDGEFEVTITAERRGIDWCAWGVPNEEGEITFNKEAYDYGKSWGMFVEVR